MAVGIRHQKTGCSGHRERTSSQWRRTMTDRTSGVAPLRFAGVIVNAHRHARGRGFSETANGIEVAVIHRAYRARLHQNNECLNEY